MDTPALDKLLDRCNEMDITEQINWLGDANIPFSAQKELAALKSELAECARVIAPFADKYNVLNEKGLTDSSILLGWPINEPYLRAAAELAKKLEGMK